MRTHRTFWVAIGVAALALASPFLLPMNSTPTGTTPAYAATPTPPDPDPGCTPRLPKSCNGECIGAETACCSSDEQRCKNVCIPKGDKCCPEGEEACKGSGGTTCIDPKKTECCGFSVLVVNGQKKTLPQSCPAGQQCVGEFPPGGGCCLPTPNNGTCPYSPIAALPWEGGSSNG